MNLKFTLLFIASFQLLLSEPCHSRPIFSYIFGDEDASFPTEADEIQPISAVDTSDLEDAVTKPDSEKSELILHDAVAKPDFEENELTLHDAVTKPDSEKNELILHDAVAKPDFEENAIAASSAELFDDEDEIPTSSAELFDEEDGSTSTETTTVRPRLGNVGVPVVHKTVALAARTLNHGVRGTKRLVQGSLDLTSGAVGGLRCLGNKAIDGMQNAIDRGFQRTMDRFSEWMKKTNTYRKGLSGTTAKSSERGHSVTITTSSNAPVKTFNEFISNYLPAGVSDGSIPEITGIDLSKLW